MSSNVFGFIPESGLLAIKNNLAGGSGYVTLSTPQTITGLKTFDQDAIFNYNLYTANLIASNNISGGAVTAGHIYPTAAIVFPDGSSQVTAYKSLTPGVYTSCEITVDSDGAISSIVSGSSGTIADYVVTYAVSGAAINYFFCMSSTSTTGTPQHMYQKTTLFFSNGDSTLHSPAITCTTANINTDYIVNANITNLACTNVNSTLYSPTTLTLSGLSGISLYGNGILGMTINTSGQTYCAKQLRVDSDFRLLDVFTPGSGKQSQMYHTNTQLVMYNLENSGSIWIRNKDSTGASAQGILLSYTDCTITTSNCPQINGFTQPSTADSTNKIATTAWVQSVIGTGSGPASSVYMADNTASATSYALCYAAGSPDGNKSVFQDYTGLTYTPSTDTLTVQKLNGLAVNSTTTNVDVGSNRTNYNGADNTLVGNLAGTQVNGGYSNNCFGSEAGQLITGGHDNVCIGKWAGQSLTNGNSNILIGTSAGRYLDLETNNIMIGTNVNSGVNQQLNNTILIGNSITGPTTYTNDVIIVGTSSHTQYIQGQINYYSILYYNTTATAMNANIYFTLPAVLPQIVFLKDQYTATFNITIPAASMFYTGCRLMFRKTYTAGSTSSINTYLTIAGGGLFVNYNTYTGTTATILLDSGLCYIDMVCDGTYWCINNLI